MRTIPTGYLRIEGKKSLPECVHYLFGGSMREQSNAQTILATAKFLRSLCSHSPTLPVSQHTLSVRQNVLAHHCRSTIA